MELYVRYIDYFTRYSQKAKLAGGSLSASQARNQVLRLKHLPAGLGPELRPWGPGAQPPALAAPGVRATISAAQRNAGGQAGPEGALGLSWRSYPCLGQPGPLSCLCSASMGHSGQDSGGQEPPLYKEAVPILDSTVAPRWALHPELPGNCFLGSARGARTLSGDKRMSCCSCRSSCLECTRMPRPKGHRSLTWRMPLPSVPKLLSSVEL